MLLGHARDARGRVGADRLAYADLTLVPESGVATRGGRPIALTAAAAVLAMIPLTRNVLWGPMAFAIMGGLLVATILTLVFLPTLYVSWFRIPESGPAEAAPPAKASAVPVGFCQ